MTDLTACVAWLRAFATANAGTQYAHCAEWADAIEALTSGAVEGEVSLTSRGSYHIVLSPLDAARLGEDAQVLIVKVKP